MTAATRQLWIQLLLYPGHTLPTALAPVLVGVGLALHHGVFAPLPALLGFLASWFIHLGGVFMDNHELLRRHPAIREHPELNAAVESGALPLKRLYAATLLCFFLAILPGPYLLAIGGLPVLLLGLIGCAASFAYAGGPAYVRVGLVEPVFFAMFGIVAVAGIYYIQAAAHGQGATLPWAVWLVGWPVGALVTGVSVIDDLRDRDWDAQKGWRTIAVRAGPRTSVRVLWGLLACAYLAIPLFVLVGLCSPWGLAAWLTLPWAVGVARTAAGGDPVALRPLTARLALTAMVFGAILGAGIALGSVGGG
ncbi:prenyltransferase [Haliea sp. E17]|uniref:prenyltransferase n=1 Tax=Haliea sp. E17 TaxID=3401576 RepID=UPI003AAA9206